ncbi:hypothetical protein [Shimia sp. SDUM112013]|uniref:hypothetical protein n=1 Tax=Shimia sp. SDUM112013 TaxID=3136160 RepID=UPI0032EA9646
MGAVCTLSHETGAARIHLTYDPSKPLYTLAITRKDAPWQEASWFAMAFRGARDLTISTERHALSENGQTLNVTDRGFGNVLNGLEFGQTATAFTDTQRVDIPLDGAAPEVRKFRDCAGAALS